MSLELNENENENQIDNENRVESSSTNDIELGNGLVMVKKIIKFLI
jgi:hypothetical protein